MHCEKLEIFLGMVTLQTLLRKSLNYFNRFHTDRRFKPNKNADDVRLSYLLLKLFENRKNKIVMIRFHVSLLKSKQKVMTKFNKMYENERNCHRNVKSF